MDTPRVSARVGGIAESATLNVDAKARATALKAEVQGVTRLQQLLA